MHHFVLTFRADHCFKKQNKAGRLWCKQKISKNPEAIYSWSSNIIQSLVFSVKTQLRIVLICALPAPAHARLTRVHFRCARSCFPFPVGFCSLNCKQLRKSSQFFCENKTVKQTANNREKNQTIKRQTLLELLLLKILTIKKNITQKITQHSPMCFLKTIIYDITILYHKHRTPPPYTNNKCNRNKGLLLTKLDKLLSFSYYVKVSKSQKHF